MSHIWFFALLICCFETHLAQVSRIIGENFGFLYNVKGRVTFFVLVSFLCFSIGLIGLISGVGLLVAAAYNAYVIYKHPDYEREMLENDVEQRGRRRRRCCRFLVAAARGRRRAAICRGWRGPGPPRRRTRNRRFRRAGGRRLGAGRTREAAGKIARSAVVSTRRPLGGGGGGGGATTAGATFISPHRAITTFRGAGQRRRRG